MANRLCHDDCLVREHKFEMLNKLAFLFKRMRSKSFKGKSKNNVGVFLLGGMDGYLYYFVTISLLFIKIH